MSVAVADLITGIRILLNDNDEISWHSDELVAWINDAQKEICVYKPDAYVANEVVNAEGSKQSLPTGGLTLINVLSNQRGGVSGRVIRHIPKKVLDIQRPGWQTTAAESEAKVYTFDPRDQKHFYLWPPLSTGGAIEIVYAKTPEEITSLDSLLVDDIYATAVTSYVLFRAYSKDADYAADDSRATAAYNHFIALMTGKESGERAHEPKSSTARADRVVEG